jgi:DNA-binding MarR family transcriptional regulator
MDTGLHVASGPSATSGGPPDDSGELVARALARLWLSLARVRHHLSEQAQRQGLSLSAFLVLRPLIQSGPLRSSALAEAVCMDPSWISRQVAQLVERGLVERRADPADGRVCILAATDAGIETVARLQATADAQVAGTVAAWSEQDRRQLAMLLGRLADALEAGTGPAAGRSAAACACTGSEYV